MIPQEDIEQILNTAKIEEVIDSFVPLKRRGANYIGLCPFHDEKTPSFNVNPARGIFKCFGCGKGGNVVNFLMEHNHYTYPEALRWLAQKYGIPLHETIESEQERELKDEKDSLYAINEFAQKYFYNNLLQSEEGKSIGLSYFKEREVSKQTIDTWGLGYCKQKSNDFSQYALRSGYTEEVLMKSGLSLKSDKTGELYDRFHSRVTFPIYNVGGRVLGFSARILSSDKTKAKYVNSPESPIYTKGKVLFGLHIAKNEIAKKDECYLVEGNVDAIMMSQNGVKNVVASSGTALTSDQVRMIKRYTSNVVILYDGDNAGIHATIRATDMFFKEGMSVKTVLFPDGDDPDSFARKHTQDEFVAFLKDNAQNFIIYRTNLANKETETDPVKKATLVKEIVHSISLIPDMVQRSVYIQQCASILNMEERLLSEELSRQVAHNLYEQNKQANNSQTSTPPPINNTAIPPTLNNALLEQQNIKKIAEDESQEKAVIKILLNHLDKTTRQQLLNTEGKVVTEVVNAGEYILATINADDIEFNNPLYQKIYDYFLSQYAKTEKLPSIDMLLGLGDEQINFLVSDLLVSPYKTSELWMGKYNVILPALDAPFVVDSEIKQTLLHFKFRKLDSMIDNLRLQLKTSDINESMNILQKIDHYTKRLNVIAKELKICAK
ncbi:MAG: DNA primase [Bacteroidota bacterium]|nr:DNA primase [Bacteroidota bacterium]